MIFSTDQCNLRDVEIIADTAPRIAAFGLRDGLFRPGKGKLSDLTKDGLGTREDLLKARYLVNAA